MENLHTEDEQIKAVFANPTLILAAAYDGDDTELTAAGVIAHPTSKALIEPRSVRRMFDIAYSGAPPSRSDRAFIRAVAHFILIMDGARS